MACPHVSGIAALVVSKKGGPGFTPDALRKMLVEGGSANVKDLTCIEDEAKRARAERIVMLAAKDFIINRDKYLCGQDYLDTIHRVEKLA